jgi:hypothetical protein
MGFSPMPNRYLPPGTGNQDRVRISARLEKRETEELQEIADLWNEVDRARRVKRRTKWKPANLIEWLIRVGIQGFWTEIGGRPSKDESRDSILKRALAAAERTDDRSP